MKRTVILAIILLNSVSCLTYADTSIEFIPPKLNVSTEQIGSGSRSISDLLSGQSASQESLGRIQLLAPNRTGLTSSSAPVLYWYATHALPYKVEVSLNQNGGQSLFKKNIGEINAGMQSIRLSDYGANLEHGKTYTWTITLMTNPTQSAGNLSASATIRREIMVDMPNDIEQIIKAGYWYDGLMQLIETKSSQLQQVLQQADISINDH